MIKDATSTPASADVAVPVNEADCVVILERDHRELELLFVTFDEGRIDVIPQMCKEVEMHFELDHVLFPTVMRELDDYAPGSAPSPEDRHACVAIIREIETYTAPDLAYIDLAKDLVALTREHLLEDEAEYFLKMRGCLSQSRRFELGEVIRVFRLQGEAGDQGTSSDGDD